MTAARRPSPQTLWMTRIDRYEFVRIVIDGREETRDLIILRDRVVWDW